MFQIDPSVPWPEHFVRYGFAVLRGQVSREFTRHALERIRTHHVEGEGRALPCEQWTTQNVRLAGKVPGDPLLDAVYQQPGVREIIRTMFGTEAIGTPEGWSGAIDYQIFVNAFNPAAQAAPLRGGHIDFGGNMIPAFGDAFVMQVALHRTEPFGGNITIIPGSHKLVQQRAIRDPLTQYPYDFTDFPFEEPYEFVAEPGDVLLMHHLSFHSGNPGAGATRQPRIALHCQVRRGSWLTKADPADKNAPPWVRSFTLNGYHEDPEDQKRYFDYCDAKKGMWGYWTSEDGRLRYRVYTFSDGCLRAKVSHDGGAEELCPNARFDGRRLAMEQPLAVDGEPAAAGEPAGAAGPAAALATGRRVRARTVLEVDGADPERMTATLAPADGGPTRTLRLRRTGVITTRMRD